MNVGVGGTVLSQREYQLRAATNAFILPTYNPRNQSNDAAVLKLNSAVKGIKPIKLATASQNDLERPGRALTVAGWGKTSEGGGPTPDRMNEVSLPIVSDAPAKQAWSTQGPLFQYFPGLMVATDSQAGKDAFLGDSGGPLFKPGASPTQVGIVSYGSLGTTRGSPPTAYTEVNNSEIRTFIVISAKR